MKFGTLTKKQADVDTPSLTYFFHFLPGITSPSTLFKVLKHMTSTFLLILTMKSSEKCAQTVALPFLYLFVFLLHVQ